MMGLVEEPAAQADRVFQWADFAANRPKATLWNSLTFRPSWLALRRVCMRSRNARAPAC